MLWGLTHLWVSAVEVPAVAQTVGVLIVLQKQVCMLLVRKQGDKG